MMDVPQFWEGAGLPGYDGVVWFRKAFELPPAWSGQDLTLNLAMIDDVDTTWVNGVKVGSNRYEQPQLHAQTDKAA